MEHRRNRPLSALIAAVGIMAVPTMGCSTGSMAPVATTPLPPVSNVRLLGTGDRVRVNVYGEQALSAEYQVSGTGALTLPLIGEVKAAGLTTDQLSALLVQRYGSGFLNNPRVVVEALDMRPFSVLGEVARPGQYPSRDGLTLLEAVALAGGYTYRANQNKIYIRRAGAQVEHEVTGGQNPAIAPGDIIRVGERYF